LPNECECDEFAVPVEGQHIDALVRLAAHVGGSQDNDHIAISEELVRLSEIARTGGLRPKFRDGLRSKRDVRAAKPR
jgi:GNAT superfamily N-acetyltransferase